VSIRANDKVREFFWGLRVVLILELRQRVRGTAWYVLIGIFVALVAIVTTALWFALSAFGENAGGGVFSTIIFFVLLLGTLVAPALSGTAINGDRDAGTLATTQVTLITTGQLVLGKFLAAWISALAFLVASLPFLIFAVLGGGLEVDVIVVSVVVLALELGVIAAIGVGLSGILNRPLFSIVLSYLVVAALSIGSMIAFGLAGLVTQSEVRSTYIGVAADGGQSQSGAVSVTCLPPTVSTRTVPRYDYWWAMLVANPYVVLADAVPATFDERGNPQDLFGSTKVGLRSVQLPPDLEPVYDECAMASGQDTGGIQRTSEQIVEQTAPGWFVGLAIHLALAAAALFGAWSKTNTPAKRLAVGSRIA
jgi:ABC-type transport system involved in multi-copper enzyme maturation permease subunit